MRKIYLFLPIFLIILGFTAPRFFTKAEASFSYSHNATSITVSYSSMNDFSSCRSTPTSWQINVGHGFPDDQLQSNNMPISDSNSITATFPGIPAGDPVTLIEVWATDFVNGCFIEVARQSSGLFSWGTIGSSTDTTPTPTPVVVITQTEKIVTPTPTPTPLPDTSKPVLTISTDFSLPGGQAKPYVLPPQISGRATDNKGVSKIEYSIDGGKSWIQADQVKSSKLKVQSLVDFSFTPVSLEDGNYDLIVRATDPSGNIGKSKTYTLIIDRLPPQASGLLFSFGPQILTPTGDGAINALVGVPFSVTLSSVGGPTEVKISAKNLISGKISAFSLSKNLESGLWRGNLSFTDTGAYSLKFVAVDGAGNKTERELNKVMAESPGIVRGVSKNEIMKGKITVYFQDPVTNKWIKWDGKPYLQDNPVAIDKNGNYNLFLPSGKYYLHIEADGYQSANSSFFELNKSGSVNADFSLKPLKLLVNLGPIKLYWPDFSVASVGIKNNYIKSDPSSDLIGKSAPYFNLDNFNSDKILGKPSVIAFINSWNPASSEQLLALDSLSKNKEYNILAIVVGEKSSKVHVWQKIGGYSLPMVADMDAVLTSLYNLNILPASYFIDRKGIVRDAVSGVLNQEEIEEKLLNISQ